MRLTLFVLPLIGMTSALAFGQRDTTAPPLDEELRLSDFGRAFAQENLRGYVQITGSHIFMLNSAAARVSAYDSNGQFVGSMKFPPPKRLAHRFPAWYGSQYRDYVTVDGADLYLSWEGRVVRWDLVGKRLAEVIEFDRPVRLLKAFDDRLILEDPDLEAMFSVVDRHGQVLFRFGKPLIAARNPGNNHANSFFAFYQDDSIRVLFKYYPIYRVYDVEGWLIEEGRYETPANRADDLANPALEELAVKDQALDSWHPEIIQAKSAGDAIHVYFNGFTFGLLDRAFQLVSQRSLLQDSVFTASPRVIGIDTENGRLLLLGQRGGQRQVKFFSVRGGNRFKYLSFVYLSPSTGGPRQRLAVDVFLTSQ